MGKQKKSGNRLAAQIAAEEREDDQVMLAPQQSADAPDESSAVNAAAQENVQDAADATETPAAPVTYTAEQVQQMMQEAAAKAVAEALKNIPQQAAPQIVQVSTSAEQVHFLWMAPWRTTTWCSSATAECTETSWARREAFTCRSRT